MKSISLSTGRIQATELLRSKITPLPQEALKIDDQLSAYGEVKTEKEETIFDIGMGLSSRIGIKGKILDTETNQSEVTYEFYGPLWAFLDRYSLKNYLESTFSRCTINK